VLNVSTQKARYSVLTCPWIEEDVTNTRSVRTILTQFLEG
jgi:hypothetical protein